MNTAKKEFSLGNIQAALEAIVNEVKAEPSNASKRAFFVELLCISGQYERADKQLNTLVTLEPQSAITVGTWRQLIRAAQARNDVYEKNTVPEVIEQPTPSIRCALDLLLAIKSDDEAQAKTALALMEAVKGESSFSVNGQQVDAFRDLDDVNAYVLELLGTNGKYFWIDYQQIESIELSELTRPLDTIWRRVTITLTNGSVGEAFVPAIYPSVAEHETTRTGRETVWHETCGVMRGEGLRTWLVGDEALNLFEVDSVVVNALPGSKIESAEHRAESEA